jgi:starch synthase (maltosyl-transferring)
MGQSPEGARIYNLFPLLVGSIDQWEPHLDRVAAMGFDWVFVNPFHYPGFSGSLYAVKDYHRLNPIVQGGSKKSNDELIAGFAAAAKKRGLSVMMDLVVNHTAKDSVLAKEHPEWFEREADGSLRSPFAVDPDTHEKTVWADLAEIDYRDRPDRAKLIEYFAEVIRHYAGLGIRGFRCDAAYKVPKVVWRKLIQAGRKVSADAVFAAENLGGMQEEVEALRSAGFDYLFNSSKWWDFRQNWLLKQYEQFRSIAPSVSFPETHDTARLAADLAAQGVTAVKDIELRYRRAYLFAAVFSTAVMIPVGYEYGFRRNLHVVESRPEDWEKPSFDLSGFIGDVNRMKAAAPVLNEEGPQRLVVQGTDSIIALQRRPLRGRGWAVTLINTDQKAKGAFRVRGLDPDIKEGREITPGNEGPGFAAGSEVSLAPGEIKVFVNA